MVNKLLCFPVQKGEEKEVPIKEEKVSLKVRQSVPQKGKRKSMRITTGPRKVLEPLVYLDITCEEEDEEEDTGTMPVPKEKKEQAVSLRSKSPVPKKTPYVPRRKEQERVIFM